MAILTTEHCDLCGAEIPKDPSRPGFPQLSWCFFRKGLRLLRAAGGEPVMQDDWQGKVNRLEFCQEHGEELNAILKAFLKRDPALTDAVDVLKDEDAKAWAGKQESVRLEHAAAREEFETQKKDGAT